MVRRAKVPRDSSNRIMYGRFSHGDLSGWPDGVVHGGKGNRKRKRRSKPKTKEPVDPETLPPFVPKAIQIGVPL